MSESLRIDRLQFKAVSDDGGSVDLDPGRVLVLVGPNNSGKSLALKEVEHWSAGTDEERSIFGEMGAVFPLDPGEALLHLAPVESEPPEGNAREPGVRWFQATHQSAQVGASRQVGGYQIRDEQLSVWLADQVTYSAALRSALLRPLTARLDGHTRFQLTDNQACGDLQRLADNHLGALFRSEALRATVRRLTGEAFRFGPRYFVLEFVGNGDIRPRLSAREPADPEEELGVTERSRGFHAASVLIAEQGDGVRAFCGLIAALVSLPQRTMLVDEPEAFLHPTLARRLGGNLAALANERETTLIAASHSPEFLMGCLDTGVPVTVVRLTYDPETRSGSAKHLPADDLRALMSDPLLRSTGALDGLFHRAVVVGEADADRAFYDEVNHRLQAEGRGIADCLFANAQNWQTVERIIAPLRRLGIPAAGILDMDAIAVSGAEWRRILDALHVDAGSRARLQEELKQAREALKALGAAKPYKKLGLSALKGQDRRKVETLLSSMAAYGIFLVPVGELERWVPTLSVAGAKSKWIVEMFKRFGSDPDDHAYVKPGNDDVWQFIDDVAKWVDDPDRLGIA